MAFRFGLEPVLKHRKRLEEVAQREFAEAQALVDEALIRLEGMYTRVEEVRGEIAQAERQGHSRSIEFVREMEHFISGQKIRIERARQEARQLLQNAEAKQEALVEAAKERKALAKLKDRRLVEYKERMRRMEAKIQDDQTMIRHAWGKK